MEVDKDEGDMSEETEVYKTVLYVGMSESHWT